jgi:MFS family permease
MASPSSSKALGFRDILKVKGFRILWLAQLVSVFGDLLALFAALSLITFHMHGKASQVTTLTVAYILPLVLIGPIAGVFVDRLNVKKVMIASDLIRAALILSLVFVSNLQQMYMIFAAVTIVSSFFAPGQQIALRLLMPSEGLLAANALMSQTFYLMRIASPALAGALVAWSTEKICFYVDALSFVFSAAMLSTIAIARSSVGKNEKTLKNLAKDFISGNQFIFGHRELAFVFVAMAVVIFVQSSFGPLVSIYIRDSLASGSFLFGIISAMIGVGLIVGTQLVSRLAGNHPKTHVVLNGLFILSAGAALLGLFQKPLMAVAGTFLLGFAVSLVLVPAQTLSQQATPQEMMGRVSSSLLSLVSLAQVLGLLLSGYLAQMIGIRSFFLSSSGVTVLLALLGYAWIHRKTA